MSNININNKGVEASATRPYINKGVYPLGDSLYRSRRRLVTFGRFLGLVLGIVVCVLLVLWFNDMRFVAALMKRG